MGKYSLISFYDEEIDAFTVPQVIQGVEKEAIDNYREDLRKACIKGNVAAANIGFKVYRIGIFDENSGALVPLAKPEFIIQLFAKPEKEDIVS